MCKCQITNVNILFKSEVESLEIVDVNAVEIDEWVGFSGVSVGENVEKLVGLYVELGEEYEVVSVWTDDNEDEGIEEIELDFHVDIVDWEEDIDETVGDVEIVDCMKVVGL